MSSVTMKLSVAEASGMEAVPHPVARESVDQTTYLVWSTLTPGPIVEDRLTFLM